MKKINNALVNENTAATATLEAPIVEAVATPEKKTKQNIVGASEKGKRLIDELCAELKIKGKPVNGKPGKMIDLPSHAVVDMLLEIATDHRFYQVEKDGEMQSLDRFEEFSLRYEQDRNQERPETLEELQAKMAAIQAKLKALGLKA